MLEQYIEWKCWLNLQKSISFFVFKFKCSLYNDILFKIFRANKKSSYYTSMKLANSCVLLCPNDKLLWQIYHIDLRLTQSTVSDFFSHTEDRSEPSGATLSFLPLLPAAGMITHKFHPSFRKMFSISGFQDQNNFWYWATFTSEFCYTRISPLHYQQLASEFPLSSLQHPCCRFHGFF